MKKNYLMLLSAALLAFSASAQVASIGETNYASLPEAVAAAAEGDVVTINQNVEISAPLAPAAASVTIKGLNAGITVTRTTAGVNVFQAKSTNKGLTIQDLTIDAGENASGKCVIECNAGQVTISNVTIKNANQTGDRGIIVQKGSGWAVVENLTIENATVAAGVYDIFTGTNNALTVKGSGEYTIHPEKAFGIKADGFTGKATLYLDQYSDRTIVTGGNVANFVLGNPAEYYALVQNGNNVALQYAKPVVKNLTTEAEYTSFNKAIDEAQSGDVLNVLESCDVTGRVLCGNKNLTIQGTGTDVVIRRTDTNNNNLMFEINDNRTLTIKDITVDANNIKNNKPVFNIKGNLTMDNVVIKNAGASASLITLTNARRNLNLTNTTIVDCGDVNAATTPVNCTITLNGNTNINFNLNNGCKIAVAENGELTNTEAINIIPVADYTFENNAVVVENCTDASKFYFASPDWKLAAVDGNLVLATTTGIEDITADDNAPVEYYNLQGVRVANPENGIFIRRQGAKVQKVVVK